MLERSPPQGGITTHKSSAASAAAAALLFAFTPFAQAGAPVDPRALPDNLAGLCPSTTGQKPMLRDLDTGNVYPIIDSTTRALAVKTCETEATVLGGIATPTVSVNVTNNRTTPIFVSFTLQNGLPGPISWANNGNCTPSGVGVMIAASQSCTASVDTSASTSRFCASLSSAPANCFDAQVNHQTMIETNFGLERPGLLQQGRALRLV